jgi:tetratricopeptide (TPR) repeat protein
MLYFYGGYALIQQKQYDKALSLFLRLKNQKSIYAPHAKYYAGYCYYCQQDFPRAMAEFLSVEHLGVYKKIAPYYIVQIYYAQHEYNKVYSRAEELLKTYPDNANNDELHRMLGEMYYQDSAYVDAIQHLETYRAKRSEQKKDILRNDVYLLGMANYYTRNYSRR